MAFFIILLIINNKQSSMSITYKRSIIFDTPQQTIAQFQMNNLLN